VNNPFVGVALFLAGWRRAVLGMLVAAICVTGVGRAGEAVAAPPVRAALREPDVPYQPSPTEVVQAMLRLGKVSAVDVVYDLGCGDGRLVIAAARELGARGVCVDIDPQRIAEARENARRAGVADRIRFLTQDLFNTDIRDATAVMLFLWPDVNLKLRPKLLQELKPGSRVVSHMHDMGDWKPQATVRVPDGARQRVIYLWTIPGR
jgi:SAM-dependent methyltransferase